MSKPSAAGHPFAARKGRLEVMGYANHVLQRVLVVDPDERSRSVLETRLAAEGYGVVAVGSVSQAMRELAVGRLLPTAVVAEAELPGTDGFELCAQLRAEERTAQIPVILLGSREVAAQRELASVAAADLLVPKPVFANDVVTLVRLLGGSSADARRFDTHTAETPLPHALRALLSSTRAGRISFANSKSQLVFREGRVIDASFEGLEGSEALARMLLLAEGPYTVSFGPALARANCSFGLEELCGRVFPRLSRWQKLTARSIPLDAVLALDFKRLAAEMERLPHGLNPVLRLFDGHRDVREALVECPLNEVTALEVIDRLYVMGVLAPVDPAAEPPARLKLFEPAPNEAEERMVELFGDRPPQSLPEVASEGYDWFSDAQSLIAPELSVVDASEGWREEQLDAFRIRPEVEPAEPAAVDPELAAFARGEDSTALEEEFFADVPTPSIRGPIRKEARQAVRTFSLSFGAVLALGAVGWGVFALAHRPAASPSPVQALPPLPTSSARVAAVPAQPGPTLAEGVALYEAGRDEDAAVVLARVVDATPQDGQAWLMLGLARFDAGDDVGAQDAATRAAELLPKSGRVHMLLASIDVDHGDQAKAKAELQRYLELEPGGEFAGEAKQLLAQY